MNNAETIKYLRNEAKKMGLTFRKMHNFTIDGSPAYEFVDRTSGVQILSSCTLSNALNNFESGYLDELKNK